VASTSPSTTRRKADNDDDDDDASAAATAAATSLPFSLSLTLQNTGSVARDHLASERTFLAYVRTSLAFASAGVGTSFPPAPADPVFTSFSYLSYFLFLFYFQILLVHVALVQLFRISVSTSANGSSQDGIAVRPFAHPLGATLITFGIVVLVTGEYITLSPTFLWIPKAYRCTG
jgi:uncharacterized membrane protein YidH (DUF202 family)